MIELFNEIADFFKRNSPYVIGGVVGSVIHRMRTEMHWIAFLKSIIVAVFVSYCVGIFCKDYLELKNENIIFVCCGISGTFSKIILDELETVIKLASVYAKIKLGIKKAE